jgi:DAACS family dicarboxylate/amino acid:cation (Na+ or H+) symporter
VKLHTKIIIGLISGATVGVIANAFATGAGWVAWVGIPAPWASEKVQWAAKNIAGPVGQIFLRMLLMTIVPLVFASLTLGVAGLGDIRKIGRVGARTIAYFLVSTAIAATIGLILVNVVRPGDGLDAGIREQLMTTYRSQAEGLQAGGGGKFGVDMFVNIVPRNPIQAAASLDMLGIIFFSLVFGAALTLLPPDKTKPMLRVLEALGEAVVKIIEFAMKVAPYGVFGLIFVVTSRFGFALLKPLGMYVLVVLLGLALHGAISISAFVKVLGGLPPGVFYGRIRASMVTAFSTSSSSATLPTNIAVAEQELKIPPHIAGFVLPLGSTMCMNGTALFEGVTVLFLAQVYGVPLTLSTQIIVVILSVITAVGAAGVPGGSLPLLMGVIAIVGVDPGAIAIIIGVDRILDMSRTTLNVIGDMSAAVYVARTESDWDPKSVTAGEKLAVAA